LTDVGKREQKDFVWEKMNLPITSYVVELNPNMKNEKKKEKIG